jgi:hypothetical protein
MTSVLLGYYACWIAFLGKAHAKRIKENGSKISVVANIYKYTT